MRTCTPAVAAPRSLARSLRQSSCGNRQSPRSWHNLRPGSAPACGYQANNSAGMGASHYPPTKPDQAPGFKNLTFDNAVENGDLQQAVQLLGGILANTLCWNLSHKRGTEMNVVGTRPVKVLHKGFNVSAKNTWVCHPPATCTPPTRAQKHVGQWQVGTGCGSRPSLQCAT